jgi:hypothetical protein
VPHIESERQGFIEAFEFLSELQRMVGENGAE